MDFDSPDVMKDFPGLYASELTKKCNNDSDYSDENEKTMKKDILIGKRKDKKDKERGYAALEGESSADENSKSRSPSKSKKTKSFKFTSKTKEKREKSREKDITDRKKDRDKKCDKKIEKDKGKSEKNKKIKSGDELIDIADAFPIFGVNIDTAVDRSRCHDVIDIPLPIRECIDCVECLGISFEGLYKVNGNKSKVLHLRKMYNQRENVNLSENDIPTVTSLLKTFLRDLPEPIFTNDLLIRFEEAGAILNTNTREKHLKILIDNLPPLNKLLLSWIIIHLDNVSLNEKQNKMSKSSLAAALNHTFHCSSRLLNVLLNHSRTLFPDVTIRTYIPPLASGSQLPEEPELIEIELKKQESLLTQIHKEMNAGCISKQREELLWEVQRIITQLKRKLKSAFKEKDVPVGKNVEEKNDEKEQIEETEKQITLVKNIIEDKTDSNLPENKLNMNKTESFEEEINKIDNTNTNQENPSEVVEENKEEDGLISDKALLLLQLRNNGLQKLRDCLLKNIEAEQAEIIQLQSQVSLDKRAPAMVPNENLDEIMAFLSKENQILQIKKINLVRQIIEQKEICIDLKAKLLMPI